MTGEARAIFRIARYEFSAVTRNILVLPVMAIVLMLAYLNGAGGSNQLFQFESANTGADTFLLGFAQICQYSMMICTIMAAYLGVMSVAEEKIKGTINVLTTKPLYSRDIIIGKFLGLSVFVTLFVAAMLLLTAAMLIYYFRWPESGTEFMLRAAAYAAILSFECILTMGWAMLAGIVFKNLLSAVSVTTMILFVDQFIGLAALTVTSDAFRMLVSFVSPRELAAQIILPVDLNIIFDTSYTFNSWLSAALPHYCLIVAEIIIVLSIGCLAVERVGQ